MIYSEVLGKSIKQLAGVLIPKFVVDGGEEEVEKAVRNSLSPFMKDTKVKFHKSYLSEQFIEGLAREHGIDFDDIDRLLDRLEIEYRAEVGFNEDGFYYMEEVNPLELFDSHIVLSSPTSVEEYLKGYYTSIHTFITPNSDWLELPPLIGMGINEYTRNLFLNHRGKYMVIVELK